MRRTAPLTAAACVAILVALSPFSLAEDAPAQQASPSAPPPNLQSAPTGEVNDPAPGSLDEVVCKMLDDEMTGTRISHKRKVCRTRREWMDEGEIAQNTLKHILEDHRTQRGIDSGVTDGPRGN